MATLAGEATPSFGFVSAFCFTCASCWNETEIKQFGRCRQEILFQFYFSFISVSFYMCGRLKLRHNWSAQIFLKETCNTKRNRLADNGAMFGWKVSESTWRCNNPDATTHDTSRDMTSRPSWRRVERGRCVSDYNRPTCAIFDIECIIINGDYTKPRFYD